MMDCAVICSPVAVGAVSSLQQECGSLTESIKQRGDFTQGQLRSKTLQSGAAPPRHKEQIRGTPWAAPVTSERHSSNPEFTVPALGPNARFAALILALLKRNMNVHARKFVIAETLLYKSVLYLETISILHCLSWRLCHKGLVGH